MGGEGAVGVVNLFCFLSTADDGGSAVTRALEYGRENSADSNLLRLFQASLGALLHHADKLSEM